MPTCPSGYSWINGQCVKNPGPNPPLAEETVAPIEQEDVQEDKSEDED